jgi:DNA-binding CsgD family transcriptional regulator
MSPARRRRSHRLVGEALAMPTTTAGYPAERPGHPPDPDAVADHFRRAGDGRAAEWLIAAGERAQRAYAWLTAANRFAAALALLEAQGGDAGRRGWLAFRVAVLRRYSDRRTLADVQRVAVLAAEAGDRLLAAVALFLEGELFGYVNRRGHGITLMEAGLTALGALPEAARVPPWTTTPIDPAGRWGTVVLQLSQAGRYVEAITLGERHLAEVAAPAAADWLGGNPYADALAGLGMAHAALGQSARGRAALARAKTLNHAIGHHARAGSAAVGALWVAEQYEPDRPAELRHLLAEADEAFAQATELQFEPVAHGPWARLLRQTGCWAELRAVALASEQVRETLFSVEFGHLARAQGEPGLAWARVMAALPDGAATEPGDLYLLAILRMQRLAADLALDAGDPATARAWLAAHDHWLAWSGTVLGRAEGQLSWARHYRLAGDPALARQHAERALAHASNPRQPLALLAAHRLLGELDTAAGRHAEADAHLAAALALAGACAAPYECALTLLALAELFAATRRAEDATARLAEARAICAELGAAPALARADALAATLGAPAPTPSHPDGLTAREVEVLRLYAADLPYRAIADRLSIAPRTVGTHITNIFGKTGIGSRLAAATYAARHDLA